MFVYRLVRLCRATFCPCHHKHCLNLFISCSDANICFLFTPYLNSGGGRVEVRRFSHRSPTVVYIQCRCFCRNYLHLHPTAFFMGETWPVSRTSLGRTNHCLWGYLLGYLSDSKLEFIGHYTVSLMVAEEYSTTLCVTNDFHCFYFLLIFI